MRILKYLVNPSSVARSYFAISLLFSGLAMAEDRTVKIPANEANNTPATSSTHTLAKNASQPLVTPQLQDGQDAFNTGNYDLAFSLWQTLATQGHSDAQVFVGLSYANGWGVDKNTKLASHWYLKAANNNNASGQFLLGLSLISGKEMDLSKGVMWLQRAAKNGDTSAIRFLKKAKRRGWFDKVPEFKQDKGKSLETVAMVNLNQ